MPLGGVWSTVWASCWPISLSLPNSPTDHFSSPSASSLSRPDASGPRPSLTNGVGHGRDRKQGVVGPDPPRASASKIGYCWPFIPPDLQVHRLCWVLQWDCIIDITKGDWLGATLVLKPRPQWWGCMHLDLTKNSPTHPPSESLCAVFECVFLSLSLLASWGRRSGVTFAHISCRFPKVSVRIPPLATAIEGLEQEPWRAVCFFKFFTSTPDGAKNSCSYLWTEGEKKSKLE